MRTCASEFSKRAAPLFAGAGETFLFVAEDVGAAYAVTAHADRFELHTAQEPGVQARGSAEGLFRFVSGRASPDDLRVSGDAALLRRWHDRVRV